MNSRRLLEEKKVLSNENPDPAAKQGVDGSNDRILQNVDDALKKFAEKLRELKTNENIVEESNFGEMKFRNARKMINIILREENSVKFEIFLKVNFQNPLQE
ncbi:MAG: hypothetical protein MHMPM18_002007 [Marteilia pararefringens]